MIDAAGRWFAERKALKLSDKILKILSRLVLCAFPAKLCSGRVQSSAFRLLQESYTSFLTHNLNIYTNMYS